MLKTHLCLEQTMIEPLLPRRPPARDPQLLREVGINVQTHTTAGVTNLPKRLRLEEDNVTIKIFTLLPPLQRWDKRVKNKWPGQEADVRTHSLSQAMGCLICVIITFQFLNRVRGIEKSDYYLCHVCPSIWNNSAPTERIFMKFGIWGDFVKPVKKIQITSKSEKNKGRFIWRPI